MHSIVLVRGRKLVDQASQRLLREMVPHGVLMNGHWLCNPQEKTQVCSIDTLIARNIKPKADLIIIDECHNAASKGYKEFLSHYPNAYIVSVTATPWVDEGLEHIADTVVHPITMQELIDQGYLVPFRYYAPNEPDLEGVSVSSSTKDYVTNELQGAMIKGNLTGKIVSHWKEIASNRPTLLFAVNVKHSKILCERFNKSGIKAEHIDASMSDENRNEIIKRLEKGETKVICSVGTMSTGVDIPCLGCVILARPTKSRNLFIQQLGRGTRINDLFDDCIVLDHAGNIDEHGFPTDEPEVNLKGKQKRETLVRKNKTCEECFAVYVGLVCPECGSKKQKKKKADILEDDGKLKEIKKEDFKKRAHKLLIKEAKEKGFKKWWAHYKLVDKFGIDSVEYLLPPMFVEKYKKDRKNIFQKSPFNGRNKTWRR